MELDQSYSKYNKLMEEYENMRDMHDTLKEEFEAYVERSKKEKAANNDKAKSEGSQSNINGQQENSKKKSKFGGFLGFWTLLCLQQSI